MHYEEAYDGYAAQGIRRMDAEIVKKSHVWMETNENKVKEQTFMKQHRRNGVFAAVGLLIFFAAMAASASVGPKIAVDQRSHDFGQVWEDAELKHTFTITNQGDEELVVRHVKTS